MIVPIAAHSHCSNWPVTTVLTLALAYDIPPPPPASNHHGGPFEIPSVATESGAPAFFNTLRRPWRPAWRPWKRQVHFRRGRGAGMGGTGTVAVATVTVREVIANHGSDGRKLAQYNDVLGQPVYAAASTTTAAARTTTATTATVEAGRAAAWGRDARVARGPHRLSVCPPTGFL